MEPVILDGESKNVEYKEFLPEDSTKYIKTVVAFANGSGGKIIFGVKNATREAVGVDPDKVFQTMDAIANAISDSCEPRILPDIYLQTVAGRTLIVVEILPGALRPYYIKSKGIFRGTYIRVAGTSRPADSYLVKELILAGENRFFDSEVNSDIPVTDEAVAALCRSLMATARTNILDDGERAQLKTLTRNTLIAWGVLVERGAAVLPTNAYALLTGKFKNQPPIQCAVFKGRDRAYFVDRREFSGTVQEQVEAAYQYVLLKINMGMKISGIYRQDVYELPPTSIRELIANAVVHRSYLEPGSVQVALYDDRLEVTSPGSPVGSVSVRKMLEGYSKLRNPALAKAFAFMRIIEKWGTGIPRLIRECEAYGLPRPELISMDGDFRVNMYRRTTQATTQATENTTQGGLDTIQAVDQGLDQASQDTTQDGVYTTQAIRKKLPKLPPRACALVEVIAENPRASQRDMAVKLGCSVDAVKYHIKRLKEKNILRRNGSSQKGHWVLLI